MASKGGMTYQNALDVRSAMDEAVSQTRSAVTEVTNLAQNLQEGAGPQIDFALNEAQALLENINQSLPTLTNKYEETDQALEKSVDMHAKMTQIASPLENPSRSLKSLENELKSFKDNMMDIKNYSDIAREKAMQTESINDMNRFN